MTHPIFPTLNRCRFRLRDPPSSQAMDNKVPGPTKRQRPASILRHVSTSPLPHSETWNSGRENIDNGDRAESGDEDVYSKRRRLSHRGRIALYRRNRRPRRFPSPIPEEDEDVGTLSISADGRPASTTRTTPAFESAPPTEPISAHRRSTLTRLEVHQIIGKEDVDGVLYHMMD
jgi:hypothetical protein